MIFCRGCGHSIHETAMHCPQCGAAQQPLAEPKGNTPVDGTLWLPVPALVCGLIPVLALFDSSDWDHDEVMGAGLFAVTAIVLGIVALMNQKRGSGMSIAGLVLGVVGLLGVIGSQL